MTARFAVLDPAVTGREAAAAPDPLPSTQYHRPTRPGPAGGHVLVWPLLEEVSEEELRDAMAQVREGLVEGDDESRVRGLASTHVDRYITLPVVTLTAWTASCLGSHESTCWTAGGRTGGLPRAGRDQIGLRLLQEDAAHDRGRAGESRELLASFPWALRARRGPAVHALWCRAGWTSYSC